MWHLVRSLVHWAQDQPASEALVFLSPPSSPQTITFSKLHQDSVSFTGILRREDLSPGDLVVLAFPHCCELAALFFGAMGLGAVPTIFPYPAVGGFDSRYIERLREFVNWSDARALITIPSIRDAFPQRKDGSGTKIVAVDHSERTDSKSDEHGASLYPARPEDPAYVQFSSGTTGSPKGVVISHQALGNNIRALSSGFPFQAGDVSVGWLPFFHDMGLVNQLLLPLAVGGKSVLLSPAAWLRRPVSLFQAIDEFCGTMCWMPNFAFAYCLKHIRERELEGVKLASLRILGCGGEPIQWDTICEFIERFSSFGLDPLSLTAGYGMAENVVGITHAPHGTGLKVEWISRSALKKDYRALETAEDDSDAQAVVSCGIPFENTEIAVLDKNGNPLAERFLGEIGVRGDSLFSGYYRRPDLTAQVLWEGWLKTGDLGYVSQGQLYVVDRSKDLIIVGGQNIYPQFIEQTAQKVLGESARSTSAFGIREKKLGTDLPVLVCELRGNLSEEKKSKLSAEIREDVWETMEVSLADVRFLPRGFIEKTTSGKTARAATREKYLRAGYRPPVAELGKGIFLPDSTAEELEKWIAAVFSAVSGNHNINTRANFFEQGIDSLALVQVILAVEEKLDTSIDIDQVAADPTIANLAELLCRTHQQSALPAPAAGVSTFPARKKGARLKKLFSSESRSAWIHRTIILRGPLFGSKPLPYAVGFLLLKKLTGSSFIQKKLYAEEVRLFRQCVETIPIKGQIKDILQQNLLANSWFRWREEALFHPEVHQKWVSAKGLEILEALIREGRGIILALTHTRAKYLLLDLPILKRRAPVVIGNIRDSIPADTHLSALKRAGSRNQKTAGTALRTAQIYRAHQVLKAGGVVVILADDSEGKGGIRIPFHGHWRPFRPGLGELAVSTGAAVVPVLSRLELSGRIEFEFLPPLESAEEESQGRVDHLLRLYAKLLTEHWTHDLGSMQWYILYKYLRFPKIKKVEALQQDVDDHS